MNRPRPPKTRSSIFKQFYRNVRNPRKSHVFRFQRIGRSILYAFFLTLVAALLFSPTVIHATIKEGQSFSFIFLPFALIYYYIVLTFLFFSFISILSIGSFWLGKVLKRKLNGSQAWGLTVNASTWPTLILSVLNLFYKLPSYILIAYIGVTCLALVNITHAIPKPLPRSKEQKPLIPVQKTK